MRILLLMHGFNSLSQRLFVELQRDGHELSVEFDIHDDVTREGVELFRPDVVVAPFLKRAIPASVWQRVPCLVVHPGPPGDRGPAALDWAILRGLERWGVTVLQANATMDAGPVWASEEFVMRTARKSSLYRREVTEAAVSAVRSAIARLEAGERPMPSPAAPHGWQPPLLQRQRTIDWQRDDTATILRKLHAADGFPGVEDILLGRRFRLFDAHREERLAGRPGTVLARRHGAICRATGNGAVWIGQLQPLEDGRREFKRPAVLALGALAQDLPVSEDDRIDACHDATLREVRYDERGSVGYLHFDFYNGAMNTAQCQRLRAAYAHARRRPTRVIVLLGGSDFWCNGMHLHCIEAAESPADASWDNINAIDDLARDILTTDTHLTIAALQGNAAAGGVFLALATDRVLARSAVVLNPHYRNMGNLYGSEYWTYLLPRRADAARARTLMAARLPIGAPEAQALGLIDAHAGPDVAAFQALVESQAAALAANDTYPQALEDKRARRTRDEQARALADYRAAELERMRLNFYGFDPSYHVARHRFVHRTAQAWTPLHLARHRALDRAARAAAASA
jgi:putative two-component system protein, hydrogenase maturation factor HypX/HoxX